MSNGDDRHNHPERDARLYVPAADGWAAHIKQSGDREYCFFQSPGEDHFHLLMGGELFLQRGHEKCCLNCALRRGYVTTDRLFWQHGGSENKPRPI
jgi:hypothetical protein